MGIGDRPYFRDDFDAGGMKGLQEAMRRMMGLGPTPGPKPWAVKWLLWANIIIFIFQYFLDQPTLSNPSGPLSALLGVTVQSYWQVWRYLTFQFLHGGMWHILLNMLALFILGRPVERQMGSVRFLIFYLTCGMVAGVAYELMVMMMGPDQLPANLPLIGASGGVFAVLLACAVRFPQMKLLIMLIYPVPIRVVAAIAFGGMVLVILSSIQRGETAGEFWSHIAHLGGAVGGAVWIWGLPGLMVAKEATTRKINEGAWNRKVKRREETEKTVDEILRKVHHEGINSLTKKEKDILADATQRQRDGRW